MKLIYWVLAPFMLILIILIPNISFADQSSLSPYRQMANGILPEDVVCSQDMVLIDKVSTNSPVCLKLETAQNLVERGWGILASSMTSEQKNSMFMPYFTMVSNANYTLNYAIADGIITKIKNDAPSKSLILLIEATSKGNLTIDIPRALNDAKTYDGKDIKFAILVNGQLTDYHEIKTTRTDRTVTILFNQGSQEIEFVGMQLLS